MTAVKNQEITTSEDVCGFNPVEVLAIKSLINGNPKDDDMMIFLHICQKTKLDPFAKQIYGIIRGGKLTVQTSIDGFRLIADRTGKYAPGRPTEFSWDDKGRLVAAISYVKKRVGDTWHEVGEAAYMAEFQGGSPFWKKMPTVMLSKTAEARALRRAFPNDLSGLYTGDEMDQTDQPAQEPIEEAVITPINDWQASLITKEIGDDKELLERVLNFSQAATVEEIKGHQFETVMKTILIINQKKGENND